MRKFKVEIELGNDAMQSDADIADALNAVAIRVLGGQTYGGIGDANGNTVGYFELKSETDAPAGDGVSGTPRGMRDY